MVNRKIIKYPIGETFKDSKEAIVFFEKMKGDIKVEISSISENGKDYLIVEGEEGDADLFDTSISNYKHEGGGQNDSI